MTPDHTKLIMEVLSYYKRIVSKYWQSLYPEIRYFLLLLYSFVLVLIHLSERQYLPPLWTLRAEHWRAQTRAKRIEFYAQLLWRLFFSFGLEPKLLIPVCGSFCTKEYVPSSTGRTPSRKLRYLVICQSIYLAASNLISYLHSLNLYKWRLCSKIICTLLRHTINI